jgi:hypothetical protein
LVPSIQVFEFSDCLNVLQAVSSNYIIYLSPYHC